MADEYVGLGEALLYAMIPIGSLLVWLASVALVMLSFLRLRRPAGVILAVALAMVTAVVIYSASTVAWIASLVLILAGFTYFRRPGAILVIVCVMAWVATTWTRWGTRRFTNRPEHVCFLGDSW